MLRLLVVCVLVCLVGSPVWCDSGSDYISGDPPSWNWNHDKTPHTTQSLSCSLRGWPQDDVRGFSSWNLKTPYNNTQVHTLHYTLLSQLNWLQSNPNNTVTGYSGGGPGWPTVTETAAPIGTMVNGYDLHRNGTYSFQLWWSDALCSDSHDMSMTLYLIEGAWSTTPPGGAYQSPLVDGWEYLEDPGANPELVVYLYQSTWSTPVDGTVTLSGANEQEEETTDGVVDFGSLNPGMTHVHVVLDGSPAYHADREITLYKGIRLNLQIMFSAGGGVEFSGGEESSGGTGGWTAELMKSLFLPAPASVDAVKAHINALATWGPLGLVADILSAFQSQPIATDLAFPVPAFETVVDPETGYRSLQYVWDPVLGNAPQHVFERDQGVLYELAQTPGYQLIRTLMGIGVWVTFVVALVSRFMPKAQM